MPAPNHKIYVDQGSTLSQRVTMQNSDGSAYNLTGVSLAGKVRPTATSTTLTVALTLTIESPATAGIFTISLTAVQTAALPVAGNDGPERVPTVYAYDIELTNGSTVTRLMQGEFIVSPEVTR